MARSWSATRSNQCWLTWNETNSSQLAMQTACCQLSNDLRHSLIATRSFKTSKLHCHCFRSIVMSMSVCLFVSLSVFCPLASFENHKAILHRFCTCCLPPWLGTTVAIRYELPVLWMTSYFHTVALWLVIPMRRQNTTSITMEIPCK